jgi:acetyl esterase/lipase
MPSDLPRPPYEPELAPVLAKLQELGFKPKHTRADIEELRQNTSPKIEDLLTGREVQHEERTIPSTHGSKADLPISIFRPSNASPPTSTHPGIFFTHGGGFICGNRHLGISTALDWVEKFSATCVSIDYRLAPEHPDPTPLEDCYAGLLWVSDHAAELGINPDLLIIAGSSAGGGLAAGVSLLARDRAGPKLRAQLLIYPMLDDRDSTTSTHQYSEEGLWSRESNQLGWECLLGEARAGGKDGEVSIYAAPARATDLSGLPETFLDVGSAEVFRDEVVAYASTLWRCGVQAELHVWPGGFHGFDLLAPEAKVSVSSIEARTAWLGRVLSLE